MAKTSATSKNRWNEKAYDRIYLMVEKGKKQTIREYAEKHGESINGFINRLIAEAMEKDK